MNKKLYKLFFVIVIYIGLIYFMIYLDIWFRARSAYLEAEKYMSWYYEPLKKIEFFEKKFQKEKNELDKLFKKGKMTQDEYNLKLELLEFKKNKQIEESSLKYAYIWYKTVIDLFSPPESKWVKLAKQKIGPVKEMWRKELEAKGYKVEDYMLE